MGDAVLLLRDTVVFPEDVRAELVVWRVPAAVPGSEHGYKYRLALVAGGVCVLRYDNERGKGDHRHLDDREVAYRFRGPDALVEDFMADVAAWRAGRWAAR